MKVILLNGSPHQNGHTAAALNIVAEQLKSHGIATEILWIGNHPVQDCIACGGCVGQQRCVFNDDVVNTWINTIRQADGLVVGTPVYYAHASGRLLSALDRLFYAGGPLLAHKPAAVIATARRAGSTNALDDVMKHFTIAQMPIASATYWPMYFGEQDAEGTQTMRHVANNLAWLLQCIANGKKDGILPPANDKTQKTNFIR